MTIERTRRMNIRSGQAHSDGGTFRIDFKDLPKIAMGHTYVRWIELAVDVRWANATGAPVVVPEPIGHNVVANLQCKIAGGHTFLELGRQAGSTLYKACHALSGKRGETPGDVSVPAGGVFNARYKVIVPIGYLPGAADPDDFNVPLAELQENQVAIEGVWASSGDFNTGAGGVTITSANTQIRRATAVMVARNELRAAPLLTWKLQLLSGTEERPTCGNHFVHSLLEIPQWATGGGAAALTETFVGTARTQVESFTFDGVSVVDLVDSPDLITVFNRKTYGTDDMLTQHEAGTTEFLPIYSAPTEAVKSTYKPSSVEHPNLVLVGTPATPLVLMVMSRLNTDRNVGTTAEAVGLEGFDTSKAPAKTLTKTALPIESGAGAFERMPRLLQKGS